MMNFHNTDNFSSSELNFHHNEEFKFHLNDRFQFIDEYNIGYLSGSSDYKNKTVIRSRFSAPGSRESLTFGFRDFRSGDFSVYNFISIYKFDSDL